MSFSSFSFSNFKVNFGFYSTFQYSFLCVSWLVHMCICLAARVWCCLMLNVFLYESPVVVFFFFWQHFSLNLELSNLDRRWPASSRDPCISPYQVPGLYPMTCLHTLVLKIELRFSCLSGKHFMTKPSPQFSFFFQLCKCRCMVWTLHLEIFQACFWYL